MLRHRRMHDPAAVAAAEAREREQMAAQPPPQAVFSAPIVNELVGGSDSGAPVNVQWMPPNRASRAYRRYPDVIPQTETNVVTPVAPGTTSYAPGIWQSTAHTQQDGQDGQQDGQA